MLSMKRVKSDKCNKMHFSKNYRDLEAKGCSDSQHIVSESILCTMQKSNAEFNA